MASSKEAGTDRRAVEYGDQRVERMERLKQMPTDQTDASGVVGACLRPPLYATRFHEGFGTLSLDAFDPDSIQIRLGAP